MTLQKAKGVAVTVNYISKFPQSLALCSGSVVFQQLLLLKKKKKNLQSFKQETGKVTVACEQCSTI